MVVTTPVVTSSLLRNHFIVAAGRLFEALQTSVTVGAVYNTSTTLPFTWSTIFKESGGTEKRVKEYVNNNTYVHMI